MAGKQVDQGRETSERLVRNIGQAIGADIIDRDSRHDEGQKEARGGGRRGEKKRDAKAVRHASALVGTSVSLLLPIFLADI